MKISFDDAMQLANERHLDPITVRADALRRHVWVAEWHFPGCLSESSSICVTKREALESALAMADWPRGMRADLLRHGSSSRTSPNAWSKHAVTTIYKCTLADIL